MVVREIMTRNPIAVEATDSIRAALDQMIQADIRHIPVVSNGQPVGMISDRDIRSYALPFDEEVVHPDDQRARLDEEVSRILQDDMLTFEEETNVAEVVDAMIDQKIGAVPIVEPTEGTLIGIVSYIDVLRAARDLV